MKNWIKIAIVVTLISAFVIGGIIFYSLFLKPIEEEIEERERRDSFSGIFPIGGSGSDDVTEGEDSFQIDESKIAVPKLRLISESPIAGSYSFKENENVVIRYVERETGHVIETTTSSLVDSRVSNETVPRVHEALFVEGGRSVIMRYLDSNETIKTIYKTIEKKDLEQSGNVFLPNNISQLAVSPDSEEIFYLTDFSNRVDGFISSPDSLDRKRIFSSPIKEWLVYWEKNNEISLNTKPSNGVPGFLFSLNTESEKMTKLISGKLGLISLPSPNTANILYSISDNSGTVLNVKEGGLEKSVTDFRAIAEKCVWSKLEEISYCASSFSGVRANYPDDWYSGIASFGDDIWTYDVESGVGELFFDLEAEGLSLDLINMFLDEEETHLFFTNKKDLTLWSLRIKEPVTIFSTTTPETKEGGSEESN
ncbi:MAG: hypothetical protein QF679_02125 [Candidatus Pacebacteria bacterium]|jgi:hypothetical protein|nr:hypothetical protein [Candidatus Paceibacterota bacterium]